MSTLFLITVIVILLCRALTTNMGEDINGDDDDHRGPPAPCA
jgi:hypothetical protein